MSKYHYYILFVYESCRNAYVIKDFKNEREFSWCTGIQFGSVYFLYIKLNKNLIIFIILIKKNSILNVILTIISSDY